MKKIPHTLIIFCFFLVAGCNTVTIPLDGAPLSKEKATVIVFTRTRPLRSYELFMDAMSYGVVVVKRPIKFEIVPGMHSVYARNVGTDRIINIFFEAGKTHYLEIYMEQGFWQTSNRIRRTQPLSGYSSNLFGRGSLRTTK